MEFRVTLKMTTWERVNVSVHAHDLIQAEEKALEMSEMNLEWHYSDHLITTEAIVPIDMNDHLDLMEAHP